MGSINNAKIMPDRNLNTDILYKVTLQQVRERGNRLDLVKYQMVLVLAVAGGLLASMVLSLEG
jgi:hypothetical protein